jgi:hypothetical protein
MEFRPGRGRPSAVGAVRVRIDAGPKGVEEGGDECGHAERPWCCSRGRRCFYAGGEAGEGGGVAASRESCRRADYVAVAVTTVYPRFSITSHPPNASNISGTTAVGIFVTM